VLSGRGFCVELITRPQESCECGVSECDREASIMRRTSPTRGCYAMEKKKLSPDGKLEIKRLIAPFVGATHACMQHVLTPPVHIGLEYGI